MIPSEFLVYEPLEAFLGFTVTAGDMRVVPNSCGVPPSVFSRCLQQTEARGGVEVDTITQVC